MDATAPSRIAHGLVLSVTLAAAGCANTTTASQPCDGGRDCDSAVGEPDGGSPPDGAAPLDGGVRDDRFALSLDDDTVVIGAAYTACTAHADCQAVEITCSGCCLDGVIAVEHRARYDQEFERACRDYPGGFCMCGVQPDVVPRCMDGECALVARDAVSDCFGPTQNFDERVLSADAVGCACNIPEASFCNEFSLALQCRRVPGNVDGLAWVGAEDGACFGYDPECTEGTIVPGAGDCADAYPLCYELPDGRFCGIP